MRVFLIGFMCSGKSTVGRLLAPMLELPFVDLDRVVEARVGPLLPFIRREGEAAFRLLEAEVLHELLTGPDAVIATGGGTPCTGDHMRLMTNAGTVIWLDVSMASLMPRIERAGGDRPLLFGLKGEALHTRVAELSMERAGCYAKAPFAIPAGDAPEVVAVRIRDLLRSQPR